MDIETGALLLNDTHNPVISKTCDYFSRAISPAGKYKNDYPQTTLL